MNVIKSIFVTLVAVVAISSLGFASQAQAANCQSNLNLVAKYKVKAIGKKNAYHIRNAGGAYVNGLKNCQARASSAQFNLFEKQVLSYIASF